MRFSSSASVVSEVEPTDVQQILNTNVKL